MRTIGQTLALIAVIGSPVAARGQDVTLAMIRDRAGCYALTLGPWSRPLLAAEGGATARTPPSRFRLDTVVVQTRPSRRFAVQPAGLLPSRLAASWALTPNDSMSMVSSTGFVGVILRLAIHGDSLVGIATAFQDAHTPGELPAPSASVIATRV